ncbi:hypothetical protein POM88_015512 [Heracleum sosnowskyi]|uniref:Serine protease n=1 Tax=Heracleum sosnowskyi TaxID=360622 RepID=A0AAD8MWA8_9APIA|nr:hypothetical protein POM88_015512 [Heracleum sosnowskyi]
MTFIEQVVEDESQMEGIPQDCSRIMNWHLHLDARDLVILMGYVSHPFLVGIHPRNLDGIFLQMHGCNLGESSSGAPILSMKGKAIGMYVGSSSDSDALDFKHSGFTIELFSQNQKGRNSLKNMLWSCLKGIKAKRRVNSSKISYTPDMCDDKSKEAVKNFNHEEYNNFFKSFNSEVAMRVRVSQKHKERNSLKNMLWSCLKEIKAKRREPIFQRSPAEQKSWCAGGEDSLDRPVKEVRGSLVWLEGLAAERICQLHE